MSSNEYDWVSEAVKEISIRHQNDRSIFKLYHFSHRSPPNLSRPVQSQLINHDAQHLFDELHVMSILRWSINPDSPLSTQEMGCFEVIFTDWKAKHCEIKESTNLLSRRRVHFRLVVSNDASADVRKAISNRTTTGNECWTLPSLKPAYQTLHLDTKVSGTAASLTIQHQISLPFHNC